jgi:hypothetical protein
MYVLNDRVQITYRNFDLVTDEYLGHVTEQGTVTRIWNNQKSITIRTVTGKTFVRKTSSPEVVKL